MVVENKNLINLSSLINKNDIVDSLEDHLYNILYDGRKIEDTILFDKGFYIEVYGNPHGVKSSIPDGASRFLYIDKPVLLKEILNICKDLGNLNDETLTINTIPASDPIYKSDRKECQKISKYL